jgi:hypothetical protein
MSVKKRGNPNIAELGKAHRFSPGNPGGGRKPIPEDVKEMARALAPEAIQTLGEIMLDKEAPPPSRVAAATTLLDRGYGRPAQTINANVSRTIVDVSDQELLAIALGRSERASEASGCAVEPDRVH